MIRITRKLEADLSGPRGKLISWVHILLSGLPQSQDIFFRSWLWTIINWIVKLSVFAWLMGQFGEVSFHAAWVGATAGDLTSILPFHGIAIRIAARRQSSPLYSRVKCLLGIDCLADTDTLIMSTITGTFGLWPDKINNPKI